jgi:CDP-glucose 4,6-dehydratase
VGLWASAVEGVGLMAASNDKRRDFWIGRRVLLTGHTGFKGSWLALWLSELGAQVSGIGLEPDTKPNLFGQLDLVQRLERHYIEDIRDPNVIAEIVQACQPQVVFHLAAQPLVRRSYRDPLVTWATNVQGSLHVLEALKTLDHPCAVVMVTTDKVYENQEWAYGYRETDRLGGYDPYSASKAAAELAIASWRNSFCGTAAHQTPHLAISTARAGNVIGGGDWAEDRIVPDAMRALAAGQPVPVRNPHATRPWQHVLEPLGGYLCLAEALAMAHASINKPNPYCEAFNFGPMAEANRSVKELIQAALQHWAGQWKDLHSSEGIHEAGRLHLQIDKAYHQLNWKPRWSFSTSVERTVGWYRAVHRGATPLKVCLADLIAYQESEPDAH